LDVFFQFTDSSGNEPEKPATTTLYILSCMRLRKRIHEEVNGLREIPTVYEVAALAGVSTASVSRVLAGNSRVRPDTRDKVLAAVAELGYVPSGAAQNLASRRTGVLGLCFPDLVGDQDIVKSDTMYWYDELIKGVERAARRSGFAVLIAASHESDDENMVTMVASRCDGLAVVAHTVPTQALETLARRMPVVVLAGPHEPVEPGSGLDHLSVASHSGAYEMTGHLLNVHGYRTLRFVAGPDSPDSASRFQGFREAMQECGLPVPDQPDLVGDFTTAGGQRVVSDLLDEGQVPRALLCVNDQTAVGAMAALRAAGLRVPEDVAVAGFDGIQLGRHLRPGLTTVVQPMPALGAEAVRLLRERIADGTLPGRQVELPVRIEPRGSCGCPEPTEI
jgi:LacI family transcriptional regulator